MLTDEKGRLCGVIDFHLAGTDVFVGHLAGEASFLAYAADKENEETSEAIGDRYLEAVIAGYERSRPLNTQERSLLNDLIGLRRAFACYQVDEVLGEIKAGNTKQVNQELKNMIFYFKKDYCRAPL
ncbi:hypothetical protein [Paenibacillus elgii]|uniref:hypothetical protein n=1 Tax=Paenibacillus elgii TaxID=189691 RepID=UPI00203B4D81|nr:hypothetical protein [Paenibacillus elgii]MCM3268475.1 hypothetical protein [Paenibacillus elgii]